ncbi:MAG: hypothetical protein Q9213_004743 [Squamulea squamosa]
MGSLDNSEQRVDNGLEPVAIVGMGCRWPGDSESPSQLWDFLQAKKDAYSKFPLTRIKTESFYHPNGDRPGSFYTEGGCFIGSDVRNFDHAFFGIHPREAASLDPAQRKFLEVVYEAFESGGVGLDKLAGSRTGCFVGNFNYDHQLMQYRDPEYPQPYSVTGGGITVLSNRVNYIFDLKGPSMTLDTACSSSMYALHMACTAIQTGECTAAVVGGSNLILTPECQIFSSVLGAVSPTSVCHTFDASARLSTREFISIIMFIRVADATVPATEGLEELHIRVLMDKRPLYVEPTSELEGLTHGSLGISMILEQYQPLLDHATDDASYFECHGTGTAVGDPLEVTAIGRVFAGARSSSDPLLIGSIKSNMGHSEPTSGIAGIMKAVLALEHGIIPPTVGLRTLNPNIDLKDGRLQVVTESMKWPDTPIRRASINSFGYGGANAHAILEAVDSVLPGYRSSHQASVATAQSSLRGAINGAATNGDGAEDTYTNGQPNGVSAGISNGMPNGVSEDRLNGDNGSHMNGTIRDPKAPPSRTHFLLPFSAHDERTLQANFAALRDTGLHWDLADIAYTLSERRSLLTQRAFVVAEVGKAAEALAIGKLAAMKKQGTAISATAFVFTGQGAQWPQMGFDLMHEFPIYQKTIRNLDRYLDELQDGREWSIEIVLQQPPDAIDIHNAQMSQPLVTAIQIALVNLLADWGITPGAVVGHSSGEIAAAYTAGLITEQEAIVIAYLRGKAMSRNTKEGAMLAVEPEALKIIPELAMKGGPVIVACHNSPESLTLSGDAKAVEEVKTVLERENKFARVLATGGNAYHSHHMQEVGEGYEHEMKQTASRVPSRGDLTTRKNAIGLPVHFFSSVFGRKYTPSALGPPYWRENLESPVLFHEAVSEMVTLMHPEVLVEIGPHSALMGPLRQIAKAMSPEVKFPEYLSVIKRNSDNVTNILTLAGTFFARGYRVDLGRVNAAQTGDLKKPWMGKTITDLPHYQWQYSNQILLHENRYTREWRLRTHPRHDVLGSRIPGGVKTEPMWRNVLRSKDLAWLGDHRLGKEIVFPSTGYLAIALEAATQAIEVDGIREVDIQSYEFRDVHLQNALIVPEDDLGVEILFSMRPADLNSTTRYDTRYVFMLTSVVTGDEEDRFVDHCRGTIEVVMECHDNKTSPLVDECERATSYKKNISSSQWYESFARVGLNYGPIFRGLSAIKTAGTSNLSEARISLAPTAKIISDESRYAIHPAALDAAMQLSILATHAGTATKFKRAYMPVAFESIKVWPQVAKATTGFARSIAKGAMKGVRGLSADLVLLGEGQKPMLEAKNILLIASDQTARTLSEKNGPYTRIVWKPEFDSLDDAAAAQLFPPVILDDDAVIPSLNSLALHQLAQFRATNPVVFEKGSQNLPAIYSGEKTGIQVALQDNLLLDNYEHGQVYREGNKRLGSILDIFSHQKPELKILEVGAGTGSATKEILPALQGHTPWRKYNEYRFTDTTTSFLAGAEDKFSEYGGMTYGAFDMEQPAEKQGYKPEWDLVVASNVIHATTDIRRTLQNIRSALKAGGKLVLLELTQSQLSAGLVLGTFSDFWKGDLDESFPRLDGPFLSKDMWRSVLPQGGFSGLDFYLDDYAGNNASATVICATAVELQLSVPVYLPSEPTGLTLVYRGTATPFLTEFVEHLKAKGLSIDMVTLRDVDNIRFSRFLFAVELESPLFLDITPAEWDGLQMCLKGAYSALWITNGNLMVGKEPLFAMISGLARGLKTEVNRLRFSILDIDHLPGPADAELFSQMEQRIADSSRKYDDAEFRRSKNITYISRLIADNTLNEQSRAKADQQISTQEKPLKTLRSTPVQLDIDKPGVLSTIYFKPDHTFDHPLADDHVEIEVATAGVNNKDLAVVTGRHHSDSFSDECAGVVTKVGGAVIDLQPGDRVYCQSFAKFGNFVRDKASFCQKMQPEDAFEAVATLPIAFCTAIYGLVNLGRLSHGETVLIQSATGAVGLAAVQIARMCGAEIYATVGTAQKKKELLAMGYGIEEDHVFDSRDSFSATALMDHTGCRGLDVILCSARGQLMHDYWRCIADCGRFVEIGRTEVLDNGKLQLDVFRRNATFTSFDLEVMSQTRPDIIISLMSTIDHLKRNGLIKPLPYTTFHASEIDKALMTFAKGAHIGKLVISYDHECQSGIKFRQSPFTATFDPEASYLLVGCLGGLGRSFSKWAVHRGARHLIYLSRTGAAKPEAQLFLDSLHAQGIDAKVQQGDVLSLKDVKAAVAASDRPIKGVIQGALTLHDGLFESMTLEKFHSTLKPRVIGTLNLHEALKDSPLDFFQMWSSWTVMFGTATQSNYLASSAFMDAFARHRQSHGLPATSLALSQILGIGIVSYMPEYDTLASLNATSLPSIPHRISQEKTMIRNGFYGNTEDEFLQYCEAALCPPPPLPPSSSQDPYSQGHLLVGIEPAGLQEVDKKHPLQDMVWSRDPRFANLIQSTRLLSASSAAATGSGQGTGDDGEGGGGTLADRIRTKVSRLLYVPLDEVDEETAINVYGIDSMIAAELRNWLFATWGKDCSRHMAPRRIIIDTDPGVDDILAMLLAFSAPPEKIQVLLISVTYGNIDVQNCLRNVISLFYHVEKEIAWRQSVGRSSGFEALRKSKPVVAHLQLTPAETWQRLLEVAEKSSAPEHGEIAEEMTKTDSLFTPSQTPAHLEILKSLRDNEPNSITIVAIGPMTNLALAAAEDPETFLKAKGIVVMGGKIDQADNTVYQSLSHTQQVPNIHEPPFRLIKQAPGPIRDLLNTRNQMTPIAEFNTFADPMAAARVYALTSPKPHKTMPLAPLAPLGQKEGVTPQSFLSSYPDYLSKRLKVTLFPMDITEKHVLTRGDFGVSLQPQLAAKSPLAQWVSAFINATFKKVESLHPEVSGDAVGLQLQLHDPLTVWYCMDDDNPKWKIIEGEDLRVETAGQWTRGMFVTDKQSRKQKDDNDDSEAPGDTDGRLTGGNGNRLNRCVGSPGQDIFGQFLLERIFGS